MKLILVLAALLVSALADQCDDGYQRFMDCLKGKLDTDYLVLEEEYQSDFQKEVRTCFASSTDEGASKNECVLFDNELSVDAFGSTGPLSQCNICQTVARMIKGAVLNAPKEKAVCVRKLLTEAIAKEVGWCVKNKKNVNFKMPNIPDFDAGGDNYRPQIINTTSLYVTTYSRLSFCNGQNPSRADNTRQCLKNPPGTYLTKTCSTEKSCESSAVPPACKDQFKTAFKATCDCIEDKRSDVRDAILRIQKVLQDTLNGDKGRFSSPTENCVNSISSELHSHTTDVDYKVLIQRAMKECVGTESTFGIDKLLNIGCSRIASSGEKGANDLKIGVNFVMNVFDALVDRVERFCPRDSCK